MFKCRWCRQDCWWRPSKRSWLRQTLSTRCHGLQNIWYTWRRIRELTSTTRHTKWSLRWWTKLTIHGHFFALVEPTGIRSPPSAASGFSLLNFTISRLTTMSSFYLTILMIGYPSVFGLRSKELDWVPTIYMLLHCLSNYFNFFAHVRVAMLIMVWRSCTHKTATRNLSKKGKHALL